MKLLEGKNAVIFGGSGKLGMAIARELHTQGANVGIHYFSNSKRAEEAASQLDKDNKSAIAFKADTTNEDSVHAGIQKVVEKFGTIDIMVNTIHGPFEPVNVFDSRREDWEVHLNGLMSQYLAVKSVLPIMRKQQFGRIIYVSAAMAVRYGEGCSMYTAVKRGLNGFCRTLAIEEAKNNIMVNIICPGAVMDAETQSGGDWDEKAQEFLARCPLGRFASSKEIANTAVYFASPLAEGITGQTLYVSGGEIML